MAEERADDGVEILLTPGVSPLPPAAALGVLVHVERTGPAELLLWEAFVRISLGGTQGLSTPTLLLQDNVKEEQCSFVLRHSWAFRPHGALKREFCLIVHWGNVDGVLLGHGDGTEQLQMVNSLPSPFS